MFAAILVLAALSTSVNAITNNSRFVDTRIGAGGFGFGDGNINPGPQVPYGALRLGPDTSSRLWPLRIVFQNLAGYSYGQEYIDCFSHTHVVGAGCGDWQNFCVAPVRLPITNQLVTPAYYRSKFSHATETARPGYYAVELETAQVRVQLTASSTHTAVHRYSCLPGASSDCAILVDVCRGFDGNALADGKHESCHYAASVVTPVSDGTVTLDAEVLTHGGLTGRGPLGGVRVFWHARVAARRAADNAPLPLNASLWVANTLMSPHVRNASTTSGTFGIVLQTSDGQSGAAVIIDMAVAISFVDAAGAVNNFNSDPKLATDFDAVRRHAEDEWADVLNRVHVPSCDALPDDAIDASFRGGAKMESEVADDEILRDSALRQQAHEDKLRQPARRTDSKGLHVALGKASMRNRVGWPLGPHPMTASDRCRVFFSTFYRTHLPPTTYTEADGRYLGMDQAVHSSPAGSRFMSDLSLWDIYRSYAPLQVITAPDVARDIVNSMTSMYTQRGGAYPVWPMASVETHCMVGHHGIVVAADASMKGVKRLSVHHREVAVASALSQCAERFGDLGYVAFDHDRKDASDTLDYAVDAGAAVHWLLQGNATVNATQLAALQRCADAYKLVFDNATQLMCPRWRNGTFFCPNPLAQYPFEHYYTEGSGTEYRYYVPHDLTGLVGLYESPGAFATHLSKFFSESESWILNTSLPDPTFWAGNEPDLLTPVQFNFAGSQFAHYSQYWFPRLLDTYYYPDPAGVPGNDDYGTMSAWCFFGYLGFYPVSSTTDYAVFTPMFDNVTVRVGALAAMYSPWNVTSDDAVVLTVRSYNRTTGVQYLSQVRVNGRRLRRAWFTHEELLDVEPRRGGALIEFVLTDTPVDGFR